MKRKIWPLLTSVGLLIVGGGVFLFFAEVTLLQVTNLDRPHTLRVRVGPSEPFFIFYTHSIYDKPVMEEFVIEKDAIILKGVRTEDPGVMEYYGFDDVKDFHPTERRFPRPLVVKRGMREGQGLMIGARTIYLRDLAEKGERIQLRAVTSSLGSYLVSTVLRGFRAPHVDP
ncbi:MAG: hypothetical protein KKE57_09680 [Proteobacteria bacterium]|nr:hypothetical protein [Pseudomonadota bacterium]